MLRLHEWPWVPLAPLLAWQAWQALRTVPRLPPAWGGEGRIAGAGPALRLLGLGDSTIAGVGCDDHSEAVTGAFATRLAALTDRAVDWHARGVSGVTAEDVRRALLPRALDYAPDVVVLSVGVNDAVRGRAAADFAADVVAIADAFHAARPSCVVIYGGMPPIHSFPALRPPLATLLGHRARALEAGLAAALGARVTRVTFPAALAPEGFAADGFHPGAIGCAAWADWIVAQVRAAGVLARGPAE